jgi:hypothetical protein
MPINGKKPSIKKLASLAALGTGALAITSGKVEASTVISSGVLDPTVGFGGNPRTQVFKTFTAISGPSFKFRAKSSTSRGRNSRYLFDTPGSAAFKFALTSLFFAGLRTFSPGSVWSNSVIATSVTRTFARRSWNGLTHIEGTPLHGQVSVISIRN